MSNLCKSTLVAIYCLSLRTVADPILSEQDLTLIQRSRAIAEEAKRQGQKATPPSREYKLTDENQRLIETGKAQARKAKEQGVPEELKHNRHLPKAQEQVKTLVEQHRQRVAAGDFDVGISGAKASPQDTTFLFASRSLGQGGLNRLLGTVAGQADVIVVMRGIPEGERLGPSLLSLQQQASRYQPMPNLILDPTRFREYQIKAVPTLVRVNAEGQELARVCGLVNPRWLAEEVQQGRTGDLGCYGPVKTISEPDLIEVMQQRLLAIDWHQQKEQAKRRYWHNQQFYELPEAKENRVRMLDPTIHLEKDLLDADGRVLMVKGSRVNPFGLRPFMQIVVVFDPQILSQREWLKHQLPVLKKESPRVTVIATRFQREDGWDFYQTLSEELKAPVFLLTPDVKKRFQLALVPSVIRARGKQFEIQEVNCNEAESYE